jgi:RNA polymerase subunit RPABC4/transcription elongation factor Spt4
MGSDYELGRSHYRMELPANLGLILQIALFVVGAYLFAVYLGLVVWTWRDIRSRSRDLLTAFLSVLMVLLFNLPGLALYFVLRPRETTAEVYSRELEEEALLQEIEDRHTCPECERRVERDFQLCPWCRATLRNRCTACQKLLNLRWEICPYCGEEAPAGTQIYEPIEPAIGAATEVEDEAREGDALVEDGPSDAVAEDEPMTEEAAEAG